MDNPLLVTPRPERPELHVYVRRDGPYWFLLPYDLKGMAEPLADALVEVAYCVERKPMFEGFADAEDLALARGIRCRWHVPGSQLEDFVLARMHCDVLNALSTANPQRWRDEFFGSLIMNRRFFMTERGHPVPNRSYLTSSERALFLLRCFIQVWGDRLQALHDGEREYRNTRARNMFGALGLDDHPVKGLAGELMRITTRHNGRGYHPQTIEDARATVASMGAVMMALQGSSIYRSGYVDGLRRMADAVQGMAMWASNSSATSYGILHDAIAFFVQDIDTFNDLARAVMKIACVVIHPCRGYERIVKMGHT